MTEKKEKKYLCENARLMAEWNFEKNLAFDTSTLTYGSGKKVWWIGKCGHEWETNIYKRVNGEGCPFCSNKRVLAGFNDLASQNPKLANEWHPTKSGTLLPTMVTANSHKKVWWVCTSGHEWEARISNRNSLGRGCPYCANLNRSNDVRKGYLQKRGSFATHFPEVASEWNQDKNDLTPNDMTSRSGQIVWWKCKTCGNEWEAAISNRSKGSGCPICGKTKAQENRYRKLIQDRGSFGDKHEGLLLEWNYEKNTDCSPYKITENSNRKAWWRCRKCSYEWKAVIYTRTKGGGCPNCIKERQISFPEKCLFFYIKQVFKDAQENYKCDFLGKMELDIFIPFLNIGIEYDGHYWHKSIAKDLRKDQLCHENGITLIRIREPKCPIPIGEQLANTYYYRLIDLSEQELEKGIDHLIGWIVSHKHIQTVSPAINIESDRIAIYESIDMYEKTNSLQLKFPELSKEWNPVKNGIMKPSNFNFGSDKKVWWQCRFGHEWQAVISSRVVGSGCPICAGQSVLKGYNDLTTTHPMLIAEWNYERNTNLSSESISAGSQKKVWWQCELGHEWQAVVSSRVAGSGCPICSGKRVLAGYNDLVTKNYTLSAEWNYYKNGRLTPEMVSIGSSKKVWWECELGHEWQASISSRSRGNGCPVCANKQVVVGFNDLESKSQDIANEWHPTKNLELKPTGVVYNSSKRVWWKGRCGHEWDGRISARFYNGNGCPYCVSKRVLAGYNDLASQNALLKEEWDYENNNLEPSKVTPNSHKKVWWKCRKCGHYWQAIIKNRNKGQGCPHCYKEKRKSKIHI
ncbi:zinc-ribbon domain-containing protein [Peribacillus sp. N1]